MKNLWILIVSVLLVLIASCSENISQQSDSSTENFTHRTPTVQLAAGTSYKKGDIVPNNEVCMVNDAFMGKKQIEVNYNGKLYYGCCEMCQKRIPQDESVRIAIDPISKKPLDKAKAVIAITGDKSEVSYFENEANYYAFFKE